MKTLLIFLGICLSIPAAAQLDQISDAVGALSGGQTNVVHDPANKLQLIKVIDEARKSYSVIKKQLELLEDARETIAKVSNTLRQVRYVDEIMTIQNEIIEINRQSLEMANELQVTNVKGVVQVIAMMNNTLISLESSLNLANHLLTDDFFKMTEAERLTALLEVKRETYDYRATAKYLNREIQKYATLNFLDKLYNKALPSQR